MTHEKEMAYWINERYKMFTKREAGHKAPWVMDPCMAEVRYCNVHREHDKVTRWLAQHWRPNHHKPWEIVLARMINYIPSLSHMLPCLPDLEAAIYQLRQVRAMGQKIFTSAYTISTCGRKMDKLDYVMEVVQNVASRGEPDWWHLAHAHNWLTGTKGMGSFLAAQVLADLKNTEGHPLQKAPDFWTWSAPGPGSLKGLKAFFGTNCGANYDAKIKEAYDLTMPLVNTDIPTIHMQDFQNCLCEFSKFMRVKYENGRARNRYSPGQD